MHRTPFHFSSCPIYSHLLSRGAWILFARAKTELLVLKSAALLSALTALQIRIANGPFPQALTLNVNYCLNLWQPVPLLFFFSDPFGLLSRSRPTLHSNRITTAIHCKWRSRETSPMISNSDILVRSAVRETSISAERTSVYVIIAVAKLWTCNALESAITPTTNVRL